MTKDKIIKWLKSEKDSAKAALEKDICIEQRERLEKTVNAIEKTEKRIRQRKTSIDVMDVLNDCY